MKSQELYIAEIYGKNVYDSGDDFIGTVYDIVLQGIQDKPNKVQGFVIEVPGKRRVFLPMTRVISISHAGIIMNGIINMRKWEPRTNDILGFSDFLDRIINYENENWKIKDFSIISKLRKEWLVQKLFIQKVLIDKKGNEKGGLGKLFRPVGDTQFISLQDLEFENEKNHSSERMVENFEEMKPADAAEAILDLDTKRQSEITKEFDIERLADVLEEMDEDDQIEILKQFDNEKIAEVLEEMQPDDAVDLLNKMPKRKSNELLELLDDETAEDLKQLLSYDSNSAGGLMTTNPVIIEADDSVAYALAKISEEELSPSLASVVFIVRSPIDTPTGKFLGIMHFQQLLRVPPHNKVGEFLDTDVPIIHPHFTVFEVAKTFATYNSVLLPVLDKNQHLLGAISVDDVLDHMLPENWRDE